MPINRFTPYRFKNGLVAKNRVVVPPMASQTANDKGFVTDSTTEHYSRLSRSNAGLMIVEYSYIHQTGKGETNQLGVDSDDKIPGLKEIASILHKASTLAGIQLVHAGGKTSTEVTGTPLMGPSGVSVPVKGWAPESPMPMTNDQIEDWVNWFMAAAKRAVAADFDLVELHAAHGYGLNQWLSPITNQRNDSYGEPIESRSRLLLRIASNFKVTFPNILLSVRLPAQDHLEGGLTISDMAWVVSKLGSIGVDLINVSSGIGGWRRPEGKTGQGYLVEDATLLKAHTNAPVMGVGGIETGDYIDQILGAGAVDFAAVGRAILKDPENWGRQNLKDIPMNLKTD